MTEYSEELEVASWQNQMSLKSQSLVYECSAGGSRTSCAALASSSRTRILNPLPDHAICGLIPPAVSAWIIAAIPAALSALLAISASNSVAKVCAITRFECMPISWMITRRFDVGPPVWIAIAGRVAIAAGLPILFEASCQCRCRHRSRHRQFRRGYHDAMLFVAHIGISTQELAMQAMSDVQSQQLEDHGTGNPRHLFPEVSRVVVSLLQPKFHRTKVQGHRLRLIKDDGVGMGTSLKKRLHSGKLPLMQRRHHHLCVIGILAILTAVVALHTRPWEPSRSQTFASVPLTPRASFQSAARTPLHQSRYSGSADRLVSINRFASFEVRHVEQRAHQLVTVHNPLYGALLRRPPPTLS